MHAVHIRRLEECRTSRHVPFQSPIQPCKNLAAMCVTTQFFSGTKQNINTGLYWAVCNNVQTMHTQTAHFSTPLHTRIHRVYGAYAKSGPIMVQTLWKNIKGIRGGDAISFHSITLGIAETTPATHSCYGPAP